MTLAGCHGPKLPGFLLPFSDLWGFSLMPNFFMVPEKPLPFVKPLKSTSCPFSKISKIEISFPEFSLIKLIFSSIFPPIPISIKSGVFLIPVF